MNPRAALALTVLLAAAGAGSVYFFWPKAGDKTHVAAAWNPCDAGACAVPPDRCGYHTVDQQTFVEIPDGGSGLALLKVCYLACTGLDGGVYVVDDAGLVDDAAVLRDLCTLTKDERETPVPGVARFGAEDWTRAYVPGEPVFEVWAQEHPEAPWRCACGGPGHDLDAGVCKFRTDGYLDGGMPVTVEFSRGTVETITVPILAAIKKWRKPETYETAAGLAEWKGNCHPMPCGTFSGVDPLPAECKVLADDCRGRVCGLGRAFARCGPDRMEDDAGIDWTCKAGQWERECEPGWECGPGHWFVSSCGECPAPVQNPDAGVCWRTACGGPNDAGVKTPHVCGTRPVNCKRLWRLRITSSRSRTS